ncbi:MAG: hypothetical protein D3909_06040 [Candidatus Electrothrix sp. ATG1]|nr:hypothetical protein [Candidatus Electrothrix sp. ATG1]MCI5207216.1 hypothetical protein [Candidatus Electrothrix sp. ATG2]
MTRLSLETKKSFSREAVRLTGKHELGELVEQNKAGRRADFQLDILTGNMIRWRPAVNGNNVRCKASRS